MGVWSWRGSRWQHEAENAGEYGVEWAEEEDWEERDRMMVLFRFYRNLYNVKWIVFGSSYLRVVFSGEDGRNAVMSDIKGDGDGDDVVLQGPMWNVEEDEEAEEIGEQLLQPNCTRVQDPAAPIGRLTAARMVAKVER